MLPRITAIRYVEPFSIWVQFADGLSGEIDLQADLQGPIFLPLRDRALFAQLRFDPDLRTVVWPNGADLAPEFLRSRLLGLPA
ncbi:MAG: DUF2442 domain-containing protein [Steroidobacteraceae bacterium]